MKTQKNISERSDGFQVRIVRYKKVINRFFSLSAWGDRDKALQAAISWRDQQLTANPKRFITAINSDKSIRNQSTPIRGISRIIAYDKRRDTHVLRYQVCYKKAEGQTVKTFEVGRIKEITADQDFHAFLTASKFRLDYLRLCAQGKLIDPAQYNGWKNKRLYEKDYKNV